MCRSRLLILCGVCAASLIFAGCTNPLQKPPKAGIQVITNEIPATVYLNGNYIDKTPLRERSLPPGEYHLQIKPDDPDLSAYETVVNLHESALTVVTWKPAKSPEEGGGVIYEMEKMSEKDKTELVISTVPESAIVSVNGEKQQLTPVVIPDIPQGEQEYQVSLPSYESQQNTINVVPGYRMYITVKLAKQSATAHTPIIPSPTATSLQAELAAPTSTASVAGTMSTNPTASPAAIVTILNTGFKKNGREVLRVRSEPSTQAAELGFIEVGKEVPFLGGKKLDWIEILYAGKPGWVNSDFVSISQSE